MDIGGKDDNGDWLVERIANSQTAAVLTGATVIQQNAWFAQQNSLLKRMGELRFNDAGRDGNWRNGIWLRTYGQFLDIDGEVESHSTYGGIYLSWLNDGGWHADLTLKLASLDNDLDVNHVSADYRNRAIGGSLELGRRLDLDQGWFLEPQLQVNYLRLLTEDYTTSNQMNLRAADMDAWQLRAGTVLGRTRRLANGGALQPYAKLGAVQMLSAGGAIRNGPQHARPNLDGTRAELGLGVA